MAEPTCVLCPVYRPGRDPRPGPPVCPGDAARLERDLLCLPALWDRLVCGDDPVVDERWTEVLDAAGRPTGTLRRSDPTAALGAGDIPARSLNPAVSGSREAPLPINVDVLDLTATARAATPLGDSRDQIGYLPVTTVLDAWVRHVRDVLHPDFHLPPDTVEQLVKFLHRHLEQTLDELTDVLPELATQLRGLGAAMRVILRDVEPVPQPLLGVRCEHCRTISTLVPWPSGEYTECRTCGQLYTDAERQQLGRRQLAAVRKPRRVCLDGTLSNLLPLLQRPALP